MFYNTCMSPAITLTLHQARALMLAAQGLLTPPTQPAEKSSVLACIRQMGALQIDTISVVARSPYFVLWSRLGAYDPRWLDEHLAAGDLFEYWAHAACFLPVEDFPLYRRRMLEDVGSWHLDWIKAHPDVIEMVIRRIQAEGALRSTDFIAEKPQPGGWWNWKAEKRALEHLFTTGELMVDHRQNFQRIYDLRERILQKRLPGWNDCSAPSMEQVARALTLRTVQVLGFARPAWVADYFRLAKRPVPARLAELAQEDLLNEIAVEGMDGAIYTHPAQTALVEQAAAGALQPTLTTLLSPFDPLVWDRARARQLFNFNYTIEVYLPIEKRQYGYFSLPILHCGQIIGRLVPKAHRREKVFEVRNIILEPGVVVTDNLAVEVGAAIQSCAAWHACPQVTVTQSDIPPAAMGIE